MVRDLGGILRVVLQGVPPFFQYPLHHAVIIGPIVRCPPAGIVQPLVADLLGQVQYAHAGFIGLFRMLFLVEYPDDVPLAVLADVRGPGDELLAAPFADEPVVGGHMFRCGGIAVALPLSFMDGQTFVPVVYLHEAVRVDDLHLFADVPVGNTVVVLVPAKVDMAVLVDRSLCIRSYLISFQGKGTELRHLHFPEEGTPGVFPSPEGNIVMGP